MICMSCHEQFEREGREKVCDLCRNIEPMVWNEDGVRYEICNPKWKINLICDKDTP